MIQINNDGNAFAIQKKVIKCIVFICEKYLWCEKVKVKLSWKPRFCWKRFGKGAELSLNESEMYIIDVQNHFPRKTLLLKKRDLAWYRNGAMIGGGGVL